LYLCLVFGVYCFAPVKRLAGKIDSETTCNILSLAWDVKQYSTHHSYKYTPVPESPRNNW